MSLALIGHCGDLRLGLGIEVGAALLDGFEGLLVELVDERDPRGDVDAGDVAVGGGAAPGGPTWVLAPAGGRTSAKRTIVRTALRGYDKPELRVKNAGGLYLGGGEVPYTAGSFDNDDAQARVRLTTGAGVLNVEGLVASTGKGV